MYNFYFMHCEPRLDDYGKPVGLRLRGVQIRRKMKLRRVGSRFLGSKGGQWERGYVRCKQDGKYNQEGFGISRRNKKHVWSRASLTCKHKERSMDSHFYNSHHRWGILGRL